MLHSRRSSLEVASSKGLMNAPTKEMRQAGPALKSFSCLSNAYAVGTLGVRRKAQEYRR